MELIISPWNGPTQNAALEAYTVTERPDDVLLLYINTPSVIVGRHQTIEAEVDCTFCNRHHIEIVRRLSGGGTVYHDTGNINYAFITNKGSVPVLDRDFSLPICSALRSLGIDAYTGPRRELLCGNYKISGTASHITRTRQLFHGTLLYRTDLTMLQRTLRGRTELRGKGVASVPSPVANLSELYQRNESTEEFLSLLCSALLSFYRIERPSTLSDSAIKQIEALRKELFGVSA